jgi:hypothetical protein
VNSHFRNPALEWFTHWFGNELALGQVRIGRTETGFELRHVDDWPLPADQLKTVAVDQAREIAQFTDSGAFRPLKSAPTLRRGWRIVAASDEELGATIDRLYPGAIADLYATLRQPAPITDYREFTARQTGMYRITNLLDDSNAAAVVEKCCAREFCLKRRFWDVASHAPEDPGRKSVIPCLEPCAILLEYARKVVRAMQHENAPAAAVLSKIEPHSRPDAEAE